MSRHCSKNFMDMSAVINLPIAISRSISLTKNGYIRMKTYFYKIVPLVVISMCSFLFPSYFYFYRNCKTYIKKVFWMLLLPNKPSLCWPFAIPLKLFSYNPLAEGTWTILYWVFICLQDLYSWQQIHFSLRCTLTPADNTIKTSHLSWIPKPWQENQ